MQTSLFQPFANVGRVALQALGAGFETFVQFLDRPIAIDGLQRDLEADEPKPRRNPPLSQIPKRMVRKGPKVKFFHFKGAVWGDPRTFRLSVDLDRRMIDTHFTDRELLTRDSHTGSAGIVGGGIVLLFGAITIPTMAVNHWARRRQEKAEGMSWHGSSFLRAAKPLLSEEDHALIAEAFRNSWAHAEKMSVKIGQDDAAALLAGSPLTITYCSTDGLEDYDPKKDHLEQRVWRNADGDLIAECRLVRFADGRLTDEFKETPTLRVLGSTFTGDDFTALYDLAATRTEHVAGEDDGPDDETS